MDVRCTIFLQVCCTISCKEAEMDGPIGWFQKRSQCSPICQRGLDPNLQHSLTITGNDMLQMLTVDPLAGIDFTCRRKVNLHFLARWYLATAKLAHHETRVPRQSRLWNEHESS